MQFYSEPFSSSNFIDNQSKLKTKQAFELLFLLMNYIDLGPGAFIVEESSLAWIDCTLTKIINDNINKNLKLILNNFES